MANLGTIKSVTLTNGDTATFKIPLYTGTGTTGQAGSSSKAYIPSVWTFNIGYTPVAGDMIMIKIPAAGIASGVWISVDNGTTYYPIATVNKTRLTTQYPVDAMLMLMYEPNATTTTYGTDTTGAPKGSSTADLVSNRWTVVNGYDAGAETITGNKVFQGNVTVQNGANEGIISFSGQSGNANAVPEIEIVANGVGRENGRFWNPDLQIKVHSTNSDGEKSEYCEIYGLPAVDGMLEGNEYYSILTTKDSLANNLTTEYGGMALDARQGKVLNEKLSSFVQSKVLSKSGATQEFNIPSNFRGRIDGLTSDTSKCFSALVISFSTGAVYTMPMFKGSNVTLTTATNKLTVTLSASSNMYYMVYAVSKYLLDGVTIN